MAIGLPIDIEKNNRILYRGDYLSVKLLIILITVCALQFFMFKFLGKGERVIELLGIMIIVFSLGLYSLYQGSASRIPGMFNIHIAILFFLMFVSALAAEYFHNQSIWLSIYEMRVLYYLLFYYLIHYLAPRPSWIKNFVYWLGIIGGIMYLLQYFAYPIQITDAKMFIDRGTLRINLPGSTFRHLAFFLCAVELFRKFSWKYAFGLVLLLVVAILSAYRSVLALYVLLPSVYLLTSPYVKNRLLILLLGFMILVSGFFAFQGIVQEMQETALRESRQGKENIRYRSAEYYLKDSKRNPVALITGNGQPSGHSRYGLRIRKISEYYGYYLSDIGIIGTIYKYGFIYAIVILIIIIRILLTRFPTEQKYLKIFVWMQVILIFSTSPFYEDKTGIIILSFILYAIEHNRYKNRQLRSRLADDPDGSSK